MGMKKGRVFALIVLLLLATPLFCLERGLASYYAGKFQGRLTANGEIFDTNFFTAAHKTLPFNTIVQVTSERSGKAVLVRINDRGPFVAGRIIDLSRAAADAIEMVGSGIVPVTVRIVALGDGKTYHKTGPPTRRVIIQAGAFRDEENVARSRELLGAAGIDVEIENGPEGTKRIILPNVPAGNIELIKLRLAELGFPGAFVR